MIVRLAGLALDAWDAVRSVGRRLRVAWLALPGELVAVAVLVLSGIPRDAGRRIRVVGTPSPWLEAVVVEDPRTAWYLDHALARPTAQTIGRHVLARSPITDAMLRHELEHVRQWARLGPLFLPAYVGASAIALLRRRRPYWDNGFEVAARARE